jgi:hypothetical protein
MSLPDVPATAVIRSGQPTRSTAASHGERIA